MIGNHWTQWARRRSFSPIDVPETKLWFSPRHRITNLSGAASAWSTYDNVYAAANATGSERPLIATGINGRDSLTFNSAAAKKLTNTTDNPIVAGASRYVLIVAKAASSAGGWLFSFRTNITGGRQWILGAIDLGAFFYFTDSVSENVNDGVGNPDSLITSPFIIEYEITAGAALVVRINGVNRPTGGAVHSDPDSGSDGFIIGSRGAGNQAWEGDIGDIYCASPIPSALDKTRLRNHFALINGSIAI